MPETVHTKTRRIAKNTVQLYIRSLVSLLISLYTSRLVLKGLGVDDYGIYGVVGGFVSMFSIVASSLNGAISRFLNYAMGKGNQEELRNTFSLSLSIMVILSVIVVVLTETFGLWFLYNRMTIPPDRINAAFWCFQFSILSSVSSFLVVSFTSSIIAHEKMGVFAYIDVGEVVLKFLIALLITFSIGNIDKLVLYAALLLCVTLTKQMISRIYAMRHFEECRLRWYWNTQEFWEMFTYAGWSFLGKTSGTFAGQGVNMIINVVFGPAVNAARSLSGTVNHSVQIFVNNFTMAINPQITQSYAAGDHGYMKELLFRGTKFTFFFMWMIAFPLILETKFVVDVWLGSYPEYTIVFMRLALLANTISILQVILAMGIRATGKIVWYQVSFSLLEFLHFGLAYVLLHNGFSPVWSYYCGVIIAVLKVFAMWVMSRKQLNISIREFLTSVVTPLLLTVLISVIIPLLPYFNMQEGVLRFIIVLGTCILSSGLTILFVGCTRSERGMLLSLVHDKLKQN